MKYLFLSFFCIFSLIPATFAACPKNDDPTKQNIPLSSYIEECAKGTTGVDPSKTGDGVGGFKEFVKKIVTQVVTFGALFAVGAIVWAGIQYTKSFGDDEAVKQAKNT